jgi:DNA-binding response OmpR family regulator
MVPELDGLSIVETLRAEGISIPVLFLSKLHDPDDCVRSLRAGGDGYLTMPFVLGELEARVEALLRRSTVRCGRFFHASSSFSNISCAAHRTLFLAIHY